MKLDDVLYCSFTAWYPKFSHITIKSCVIPLPQDFLDYLNEDGVVLPEGSTGVTSEDSNQNDDNLEGEDLDVIWDSDTPGAMCPKFLELDSAVKKYIKSLGGVVFPKLNWSAPRDATWIAFDHTLKCKSPSDIYLLLKSSEFISHDLNQPFLYCEDWDSKKEVRVAYHLVLRKWLNVHPGYEFRCFVKNNNLIGISQRNHTAYYDFIGKERDDIIFDIQDFYADHIHLNFPCQNYVFDMYRQEQGDILLIDFNPFGEVTDGLLFDWTELENNDPLKGTDSESIKVPAFRYVAKSKGVQPDPLLTNYGVPRDILDLASGTDHNKLIDLLQLKRSQQEDGSSSEDESDVQVRQTDPR
ncbi:hypothetical protein FSP39_023648 [Pinctada imbricata]|uniref:Cell division cycle protein 123 homolog n=1 Tax=Pinctada imbricata TaxID=66713 RepID=A0AA89C7H1_PINIB|nr:hypothetical protein FSP39_023648 [Pinctada imbricata]